MMCALLQMNESGMLAHLAATLSAGLVAIRIKTLVCLTVAGAAGLVTPPASGTRQVGPVDTDITGQLSCLQCRRKNTAVFFIIVIICKISAVKRKQESRERHTAKGWI